MTLVSSIIRQGFREGNTIAKGQPLDADEIDEGMTKLQSLVSSAYGNEVGEILFPWPLGNYGRTQDSKMWISEQQLRFPQINSTLVAVNEEAIEVHLPTSPSDGARMQIIDPYGRLAAFPVTLQGNGRTIEGAADMLLNVNGMNRTWIFRMETGNWVRITDLDYDGVFPFEREYDDYFVIALAIRIAPSYEQSMSKESLARYKDIKRQFIARYLQSAPLQIDPSISFGTLQSYNNWANNWYGAGNTQEFNNGSYWGWAWWGNQY